jgi:DNA-binding XRE family transcriptional regulator
VVLIHMSRQTYIAIAAEPENPDLRALVRI